MADPIEPETALADIPVPSERGEGKVTLRGDGPLPVFTPSVEVKPADIVAIEGILKDFGSTLHENPQHTSGQITDPLLEAIDQAVLKVEEGLKIEADPNASLDDRFSAIKTAVDEKVNHQAYKIAKGYLNRDGSLNEDGKAKLDFANRLPGVNVSEDEIQKLYLLEKHADTFIENVTAIDAYQKELAVYQQNVQQPLNNLSANIQGLAAANQSAILALKRTAKAMGAPNITVDGTFDNALLLVLPAIYNSYALAFGMPEQTGYFQGAMMDAAKAIPAGDPKHGMAQHFITTFKPFADEKGEFPDDSFLGLVNTQLSVIAQMNPDQLKVKMGRPAAEQALINGVITDLNADLKHLGWIVSRATPYELVKSNTGPELGIESLSAVSQIITSLRHPDALNIPLMPGEDNIARYTPELGHVILEKLQQRQHQETAEFLASNVEDFTPPGSAEGTPPLTGAAAFIARLDYAFSPEGAGYQQNHLFPVKPKPDLTQVQQDIVAHIYERASKMDPAVLPMVEIMMRDFTGGAGLAELDPDLFPPAERNALLAGLPVESGQAMAQLYENLFEGKDMDERKRIQTEINELMEAATSLPYGNAKRRAHFGNFKRTDAQGNELNVVELDIFSRLEQQAVERGLSNEKSAELFSDYYLSSLLYASRWGAPDYQRNPGYAQLNPAGQAEMVPFSYDPTMHSRLMELKFDPDGDGSFTGKDIYNNITEIEELYKNLNNGYVDATQTPAMFKGPDGEVYIGAVELDSGLFTVYPLEMEKMEQMILAAEEAAKNTGGKVDKLALQKALYEMPGYKFASRNCLDFFGDYLDQGVNESYRMIFHVASLQDNFDDTITRANVGKARTIQNEAISRYSVLGTDYDVLQQNLLRTKTVHAARLAEFNNDIPKAVAALTNGPEFFIDKTGISSNGRNIRYYAFAVVGADDDELNNEDYCAIEVTDEVQKYLEMSEEERHAVLQSRSVEETFPRLTTVAYQYPNNYNSPFDLVEEILANQLTLDHKFQADRQNATQADFKNAKVIDVEAVSTSVQFAAASNPQQSAGAPAVATPPEAEKSLRAEYSRVATEETGQHRRAHDRVSDQRLGRFRENSADVTIQPVIPVEDRLEAEARLQTPGNN